MSGVVIGALLGPVKAITSRGSRQTTAGTFNFTPTITGWHLVRLQAAGGAGGGGSSGATSFWGGCAGEFIEIKQYLIAATAYSYTVPGTTAGAAGNGASGGDAVFVGPQKTYTAKGGAGGTSSGITNTNHRRDAAVSTSAAPALFAAPGCLWGANGGAGGAAGGYCGMHAGGTASSGGGGGGSSLYGVGGTGGAAWDNPGTAGGTGAGGGGAASNGSSVAGGGGGAGFVEFEYLGSN